MTGFKSDRINDAMRWAMELHAAQVRKGGSVPYAAHVLAVASLVLEDGGDEDEFIAGLLHDATEDCGVANEVIAQRFGPRVARIVATATDSLPDGRRGPDTWRERKERYLAHLKDMSEDERRVALADKLHNARALLRDYRELGDRLWPRFNAGREDQRWYYRGLADALAGPSPNAKELAIIVGDLFG
jgi:(p)ppGpp synthase/HD superfamily hydrolase